MTSDWWFLAMIGSAASAVGGALGTAASSALSTLGHLAGSAASGIGTAATGALNSITGGTAGGAGGAGGAAAAAPAATASGAGGVIPASEVASAGPAASVSTANLPAAAGGQTIAASPVSAPPMGGGPSTPSGGLDAILHPGGGGGGVGTSAYSGSGVPYRPPMGAETPTLNSLTNVPELGQYGAGAAQQATPTTFQLPSSMGGPGAPGYTGAASAPTPSFLSQLATTGRNNLLQGFGVTNPNMGWGDMLKQAGLSQIAGGPFVGYNPQASFLSNLAGAGGQRLLSSLFPGQGGQQPQSVPQAVQMMLATQGQPARQLPVYGNLPGYG